MSFCRLILRRHARGIPLTEAPEVLAAIDHVYARTKAAGKAIGTVVFDEPDFQPQIDKGVTFLGLGGDSYVLQRSLSTLASKVP